MSIEIHKSFCSVEMTYDAYICINNNINVYIMIYNICIYIIYVHIIIYVYNNICVYIIIYVYNNIYVYIIIYIKSKKNRL